VESDPKIGPATGVKLTGHSPAKYHARMPRKKKRTRSPAKSKLGLTYSSQLRAFSSLPGHIMIEMSLKKSESGISMEYTTIAHN